MRTLKYAILGLLCRGPLTGYDIAKAFELGLGSFWSASHSQIYPELKKLLDEALVEFSTVIHGDRMEKKLYTITDAGREDVQHWLLRDDPLESTPKDTFKLRVYLSDGMSDEQLLHHLQAQLGKHKRKLTMLEEKWRELFAGRSAASLSKEERGDCLVLRGAIMREQDYLKWIEWSTDIVEQHKEL